MIEPVAEKGSYANSLYSKHVTWLRLLAWVELGSCFVFVRNPDFRSSK
jgi:hypothetical protein